MNNILKKDERMDDLEINNFKIIQNINMFCFGIDAVLLSHFSKAKKNDRVMDLCTGNGAVLFLMLAHNKGNKFIGIDILDKNIDMAKRTALYNNVISKTEFYCDDIENIKQYIKIGDYNIITCNPPYMRINRGNINKIVDKSIARHEIMCNIDKFMKVAGYSLQTKGKLNIIHRPNRLVEIFEYSRKYNLEPKRMQLVYPKLNKKPTMVLLEFVKDAKSDIIVEEPLIVYNDNNTYTEKILEIYNK